MAASSTRVRYPLRTVDWLKVVAAQCIIWHHLALYGPLSDALAHAAADISEWLYDQSRMAVQVFLVVAGYLAARNFSDARWSIRQCAQVVLARYQRLVIPFVAALLLTMLAAALARPHLVGDMVPAAPSVGQFLAHVGLLHSVLDVPSLSAGVWYVAIDFQLFALLVVLLGVSRGRLGYAAVGVAMLCVASLMGFNRDAAWDSWALYFFGAYGLGVLAGWAGLPGSHQRSCQVVYAVAVACTVAALVVACRERIALALGVSVLLLVWGGRQYRLPTSVDRWIARLSQTSYALFLVHFAVLMLVNATWTFCGAQTVWPFMTMYGVVAMIGSFALYDYVEQPFAKWISQRQQRVSPDCLHAKEAQALPG